MHGRFSLYLFCFAITALFAGFSQAEKLAAQNVLASAGPQLAPGVLTTIPPDVDEKDTVSVHDIIELRANSELDREIAPMVKSPRLYDMAKDVDFRRDVWCLEFSFKPLRMIYVDVPQINGKMQRKLIWYMVYRVRNTDAALGPEKQQDDTYTVVERPAGNQRFIPELILTSRDKDRDGNPIAKAYLDRIIPSAIETIKRRERVPGKLLNSVEVAEVMLEPSQGRKLGGVWGVATWEDIDPQIDFFSVVVGGLTNAYKWQDPSGAYQLGDIPGTGRQLSHKKLQLNFWRPGDTYAEEEREIRYGPAPGKADLYDSGEGVAYRWIYR